MNIVADFLAAIRASPRDELLLAAFGDFLEENADPRAAWVRDRAIRRWLTPDFADPVPSLIDALRAGNGRHRRRAARRALVRLGAHAVPELRRALADGDEAVRRQAATCLGEINDGAAVPALMDALQDDDEVRVAAAKALRRIGVADGEDDELLHRALGDPMFAVRRDAEAIFRQRGREGEAIGGATRALGAADADDRLNAVTALVHVGGRTLPVDVVERLLADPDARVRLATLEGLLQLAAEPMGWTPWIRATADADAGIRMAALHRIGRYYRPPQEAHVAALAAFADPVEAVAVATMNALRGDNGRDPRIADGLLRNMARPEQSVRLAAVAALPHTHVFERLWRDEPQRLRPLYALLDDANMVVAVEAMRALWHVPHLSREARPAAERPVRRLEAWARGSLRDRTQAAELLAKPAC